MPTKKCKYCQTDIDKKAKICPNCHKKQGSKLKVILVTVVILCIFAIIGSLNNNNDDDSQNVTSDSTVSKSPTNNKDDNKHSSDIASKEDKKSIKFGKEGKSEDLSLKINKAKTVKKIAENEFIEYKPDSGVYAVINITIKNNGKDAVSLTNGYFKLVTPDGAEYDPTILVGLSNKYISFESINPKLDITGNLVFEVPSGLNLSDTTLNFSGTGLFDTDTVFDLK